MTGFEGFRSLQLGKMSIPKAFSSPYCQWGVWQYVLLCVYSLGIEAVFNFPLSLHRHSGLFLVAYFILAALFCIPIVYLQVKIGGVFQRHISGLYGNSIPALKGVPWAMVVLSFIMCVYQSVYAMYSLQYAFLSMEATYPWSIKYNYTRESKGPYFFGRSDAETYFYKVFLDISGSFSKPGSLCWVSALVLLLVWVAMFLFTCRGPRTYGKVIVGTSIAACCCLLSVFLYSHIALPCSGAALSNFMASTVGARSDGKSAGHGSLDSLMSTSLSSPLTWTRALEQHIYNLGLWAGVLPALGCYLGDRKHVTKITPVILLGVHCVLPIILTSTIAPFVNALAISQDKTVPHVMRLATNGPSLWFVLLPEAFAQLKVAHFWAMLLYFTVFIIILHQQSLMLLVIIENFRVTFPNEIATIFRRQEYLTASVCTFGFLLGLPLITQGGSYLLEIVELYLFRGLFIVVILSALPAAYVYVKLDPIYIPIERKFITGWFLAACAIVSIILMYADNSIVKTYVSIKKYSTGEQVLGTFTAVWPIVICLTVGFMHALVTVKDGTIIERIKEVCCPSMASIYPPVVNTEPMDLQQFNPNFNGKLKTNNRFAKKATKAIRPKSINTEVCIDGAEDGIQL